MSPLYLWSRLQYRYTDDFGQDWSLTLNDYVGEAGGLKRIEANEPHAGKHLLKPRHLKVRSTGPHPRTQKKAYKDIPVQKFNPLWTGVEQLLKIHGVEYEVIGRVEEKEYGRKKQLKMLAEQAAKARSDNGS